MFKTADLPTNNSYVIENMTNPATISIKDEAKYQQRNDTNDFHGTDNIFVNSSSSDYSRFFEDFSKIKSGKPKNHIKGARSLNISMLRAKQGYSVQTRIVPSIK